MLQISTIGNDDDEDNIVNRVIATHNGLTINDTC